MPTGTFFRLPEEKRNRLMAAAWEEFGATPYPKVSINRIIQAARIPRGSFYQYFTDKEELFLYMVGDLQEDLRGKLCDCLEQAGGDLFAMPLLVLERFVVGGGVPDRSIQRFAQILDMNRGSQMFQFLPRPERLVVEDIRERTDVSALRRSDPEFLDHIFFFIVSALCFAMMEVLRDQAQADRAMEQLKERMELLRLGSGQ